MLSLLSSKIQFRFARFFQAYVGFFKEDKNSF